MLKEDLEIILITYNRKPYLKRTLEQLFADNSPVKDFSITILDNHSNDGSSEVIEDYSQKFKNLKYIVNPHNIGCAGNIAKAFETARSKYAWVICDDDYFDWSKWGYVEAAVQKDCFDIIITAKDQIRKEKNVSDLIFQTTFLPTAIYKTANFNDVIFRNMFDMIPHMFPHLAIVADVVNRNGEFYVLPENLVINGPDYDAKNGIKTADASYIRGYDKSDLSPEAQNLHFFTGYVNTLTLFKDKNAIMNGLRSAVAYKPFEISLAGAFARIVQKSYKNKKSSNLYYDVSCRVDLPSKILLTLLKYSPIFFYTTPKGIFVQILGRFGVRLIPFKK